MLIIGRALPFRRRLWGKDGAEGLGPRRALALDRVGITRDPALVLGDDDWRAGLAPSYAVPR